MIHDDSIKRRRCAMKVDLAVDPLPAPDLPARMSQAEWDGNIDANFLS